MNGHYQGSKTLPATIEHDAEVTMDDFLTGLLAGLASRGETRISIRGEEFYSAVVSTFEDLEQWADENDTDVQFWIAQNPFHGDSPDVRDALTRAVQRDLISLDNPTYLKMRIKIKPNIAERYMSTLAGGSALYSRLTDTFLRANPSLRTA